MAKIHLEWVMDIVCRKLGCRYNDCTKCQRQHLLVSADAVCKDMEIDKDKPVPDISKDMFERPPHIAPFRHCLTMDIKCDADCVHNRNGECWSNGIIINGVGKGNECISYLKK